jgi:hypothetical protein
MTVHLLNLILAFTCVLLSYLHCTACEHHTHHSAQSDSKVSHHNHDKFSTSVNDEALISRNRHLAESVGDEECGFEEPSPKEAALDQHRMKLWSLQDRLGGGAVVNYTIPTYFHVLQYNNSDLLVPDSNVQLYMKYLNQAFNSSNAPFRFVLVEITRTINATWSNDCRNSSHSIVYKTLLKRGGKESLNVYVCNEIPLGPNGGSIVGFSTLPSSSNSVTDGVNIVRTTPTDLNRPNTLVHEVVCLESLIF